jgi:hypothetical protein
MIGRLVTLGFALILLLLAPIASAHSNTRLVDDLLPPGFTQAPVTAPGQDDDGVELPSSGGNGDYQLTFRCPDIQQGGLPPDVQNATRAAGAANCPAHILDSEDIMGSPILLIDPRDPGYAGFNALHGGRGVHQIGSEPPSNQSRDNFLHHPHTTFYSPDGAHTNWVDNPYYSPLQQPPNRQGVEDPTNFFPVAQLTGKQVFGEDNAAVLDAQGRVYLASLYAYRNATSNGDWSYAIGLWKSNRVNQPVDYYSGIKLLKLPEGAKADSIHAVYAWDVDRVAVMWRQYQADDPSKNFINVTWTKPGQGAIWYSPKENQRIQSCSGISNPLAYRGIIYVGCFADKGYRNPNATIGRLQIHGIDVRQDAWTSSFLEESTVDRAARQPNAILFDRYDGHMGIASAGIAANGKPFLNIAYGELGRAWDPVEKFGDRIGQLVLRPPSPAYEVVEAQVNAAVFVMRSGNVHLIYQERYKPSDEQATAPNTNVAEFYKGLVSIHGGSDRIVNKVVHLGARNRDAGDSNAYDAGGPCQLYDARYQGPTLDVFRDLHDGLVIWEQDRKSHRGQQEYIAYADCGNVRFAEIREQEFVAFSIPTPPGTPPIPAPLASANPSLTGAVAGALAGSMVLRMLAFKRKLAVEAPA